jgi:hypothetical protein
MKLEFRLLLFAKSSIWVMNIAVLIAVKVVLDKVDEITSKYEILILNHVLFDNQSEWFVSRRMSCWRSAVGLASQNV